MWGGLAGGSFFRVWASSVYIACEGIAGHTSEGGCLLRRHEAFGRGADAGRRHARSLHLQDFNHYNWKYDFLRPTIEQIVQEYLKLHGDEAPEEEEEVEEETDEAKDGAADGDGGEGGEEAE